MRWKKSKGREEEEEDKKGNIGGRKKRGNMNMKRGRRREGRKRTKIIKAMRRKGVQERRQMEERGKRGEHVCGRLQEKEKGGRNGGNRGGREGGKGGRVS